MQEDFSVSNNLDLIHFTQAMCILSYRSVLTPGH